MFWPKNNRRKKTMDHNKFRRRFCSQIPVNPVLIPVLLILQKQRKPEKDISEHVWTFIQQKNSRVAWRHVWFSWCFCTVVCQAQSIPLYWQRSLVFMLIKNGHPARLFSGWGRIDSSVVHEQQPEMIYGISVFFSITDLCFFIFGTLSVSQEARLLLSLLLARPPLWAQINTC